MGYRIWIIHLHKYWPAWNAILRSETKQNNFNKLSGRGYFFCYTARFISSGTISKIINEETFAFIILWCEKLYISKLLYCSIDLKLQQHNNMKSVLDHHGPAFLFMHYPCLVSAICFSKCHLVSYFLTPSPLKPTTKAEKNEANRRMRPLLQ